MATVYLHIGTMKTGTSAIQSFLGKNRDVLMSKGYSFPHLKMHLERPYTLRNAHFLVWKSDKGGEEGAAEEMALEDAMFEKLRNIAAEYENIILSDEIIWHRRKGSTDFWTRIKEKFAAIGCDLKVIVYLRRQDEVVQSLWLQFIKTSQLTGRDFMQWLKDKRHLFFPFDYYKNLKDIERQISKENLIVRVYEKEQYRGEQKTIQSDFMQAVGLELTDEYQEPDLQINFSIGGNYIEIKRLMNSLPEYQELSDFLSREIMSANHYQTSVERPPKTSLFPEGEQEAFYRRYEKSNRDVAREFLGRESEPLFYEPVIQPPTWTPDPSTMYRDLVLSFTEIICTQERRIRQLEEEVKSMYNSKIFREYRKLREKLGKK